MIERKISLAIQAEGLEELLNQLSLAGGRPRIIGGAVRNAIYKNAANVIVSEAQQSNPEKVSGLHQSPGLRTREEDSSSDIDIATTLLPEEVMRRLSEHGIKVIDTGSKHGTVTAILRGNHFEITSLRKDIDCDGRHAVVEFCQDFAEDAARRDFTINALSYDYQQQILYDYHNGYEDLQQGQVRFIGDPAQRIREDYLRILRFFRFSAFYAKNIDKQGYEACTILRTGLNKISLERIHQEYAKILKHPNASHILTIMDEAGIHAYSMPKLTLNIALLAKYESRLNIDDLLLKYALLYTPKNLTLQLQLPQGADNHLAIKDFFIEAANHKSFLVMLFTELVEWKFNKSNAKKIIELITERGKYLALNNDFEIHRRFIYRLWINGCNLLDFQKILDLDSDIQNVLSELINIVPPKMPVNGHDLLTLGHSDNEIGSILKFLTNCWIDSKCQLSKQQLLELI